jgi:UDP-N-acetyl-D-mannosaminuronate dehydrogenase
MASVSLTAEVLSSADCVAILTDHQNVDYRSLVAYASLIVDTRNAIKEPYAHVFKLGSPQLSHAEQWGPGKAA